MGRPLDKDIIIKILERWQKAFKENSHYVSASDLSLVIKDVRELPTIQPVATDTNVGNNSEIPNSRDCISRQQAIDALKQPEIIYCHECKHWKDSDGVYRRGITAESKCPVNSRQVYEGTFFCGMAKRRNDE